MRARVCGLYVTIIPVAHTIIYHIELIAILLDV